MEMVAPRSTGYAQAAVNAAPKQLGVLHRLDGIRSGTAEIEARLKMFRCKLEGAPPSPEDAANAYPIGMLGALMVTEDQIRSCLAVINDLDDNF